VRCCFNGIQKHKRWAANISFEQIPGGFKVLDANGQALVVAKVLTFDEALCLTTHGLHIRIVF
jgi:hypothetical protein